MSYIYALESDSRVTDKKERDRLGLVNSGELIKCKVCSKQHKKKECKVQCKWCHTLNYFLCLFLRRLGRLLLHQNDAVTGAVDLAET